MLESDVVPGALLAYAPLLRLVLWVRNCRKGTPARVGVTWMGSYVGEAFSEEAQEFDIGVFVRMCDDLVAPGIQP